MIHEIPDDITFNTRDEFGRKPVADKVISLLSENVQVSPMIIDGGWGTGKTEFCKKLINRIKESDFQHRVVYIDAFRYDNNSEPLLAVLSAIIKILPDDEQTSLIEKALPAIKFGIKTTLKAGVSWILKQDAVDVLDDFEIDLKSAGDAAANHAVETLLKDHVASEKNVEILIKTLVKVTSENPIIIVIDELDRCRPDYSVRMLEYIKHIFNIKNIQFLLVTNVQQLRSSVSHSYGAGIDAQKYLDKFIAYSFRLPEIINPHAHNESLVSALHLQGLLDASTVLAESKLKEPAFLLLLETLIKANKLSLREVETLFRHIEIYQIITKGTKGGGFDKNQIFGCSVLKLIGVYVFCFNSDQADSLAGGHVDSSYLSEILGREPKSDFNNARDFIDILVAIFYSDLEHKIESPGEALYAENIQGWEGKIESEFFEGPISTPARGDRLRIISEAIYALKLSS